MDHLRLLIDYIPVNLDMTTTNSVCKSKPRPGRLMVDDSPPMNGENRSTSQKQAVQGTMTTSRSGSQPSRKSGPSRFLQSGRHLGCAVAFSVDISNATHLKQS